MSTLGDCLAPDDVVALLAGELDEHATARLDAHVDDCPSCAELLAAVVRSPALVAAATHRDPGAPSSCSVVHSDGQASHDGIAELIARVAPGERVGRYVVREEVGRGGMGVVYAAWDPELDRGVAIKLLRARVRGSAQARSRLLREARTIAQLSHRNVVVVFDVGEALLGGQPVVFVAMELIDGPTLRSWRWQRPHDWRELVRVYVEAGRGLQAAHAAGVIHRDFKPGNVMLVERAGEREPQLERVIVLDFGLARVVAELEPSIEGESRDPGGDAPSGARSRLTAARSVLGTPGYIAPELQRGALADARSDEWAFCMSLAEALCGAHPQLERGSVPRS
ncbi:MAG: protein kinase, partial [Deltaproteobacteria bacterium]|nr:protein kinase [Nannocystaceae bacterium]